MRQYTHDFEADTRKSEMKTRVVMVLTGVMMVVEITAGSLFHSMALLADGLHMSTHLAAFLIAVVAYGFARRHKQNARFSFGTGKVGVLGGFTSSILLLCVAAVMVYESVLRLLHPVRIDYLSALLVAVVGLVVNLVSALILKDDPAGHSHAGHSHGHGHSHDQNLRAAYVHVLTDALTSVTAIVALVVGLFFGVAWIDALMGLLGSVVIVLWARSVIRDTVVILTDYTPQQTDLVDEITRAFSGMDATRINDLHVWQVSPGRFAAIVSVMTSSPRPLEDYHALVSMHEELVHTTIQVVPEK